MNSWLFAYLWYFVLCRWQTRNLLKALSCFSKCFLGWWSSGFLCDWTCRPGISIFSLYIFYYWNFIFYLFCVVGHMLVVACCNGVGIPLLVSFKSWRWSQFYCITSLKLKFSKVVLYNIKELRLIFLANVILDSILKKLHIEFQQEWNWEWPQVQD